jgi:hypothetical protein
MKAFAFLTGAVLAGLSLSRPVGAADLDKLNILYVGDTGTPRAKQFEGFLRMNVGHVEVTSRNGFKPAAAADADVVLLDWPQSNSAREERSGRAPLGDRASWAKPTVLLGSAGLNLAVAWKARGGSG